MLDQTPTALELKHQFDLINRKIEFLFRAMNLTFPEDTMPRYLMEAHDHVRAGRDNDAMKVIREHTAIGLVEARDAVTEIRREIFGDVAPAASGPAIPTQAPDAAAVPPSASAPLVAPKPNSSSVVTQPMTEWAPAKTPAWT